MLLIMEQKTPRLMSSNAAPNPRANAAAAQRGYKTRSGDWRADHAARVERLKREPARWQHDDPAPTTPADQTDILGNTMIQRATAAMKSILRERADDPEPSWDDPTARAYWARREQARQAEMSHWRAYLP